MSFVYVVSDGEKTKIGISGEPSKRVGSVAFTVFSSRARNLNTLILSSQNARRAEAIMKSVLSETMVSAGGVHPTETFFVGFHDASAIARWSIMMAGDERTASLIGHRKKKIMPISARCKKINLRIAMIENHTKLAWLARKINISQSTMQKAASGSRLNRLGMTAMQNAADSLVMKVSELVALGEDKQ